MTTSQVASSSHIVTSKSHQVIPQQSQLAVVWRSQQLNASQFKSQSSCDHAMHALHASHVTVTVTTRFRHPLSSNATQRNVNNSSPPSRFRLLPRCCLCPAPCCACVPSFRDARASVSACQPACQPACASAPANTNGHSAATPTISWSDNASSLLWSLLVEAVVADYDRLEENE